MIQADTHIHTCFSHGQNTPFEMHAKASRNGLSLIGFSEHSPRPLGYDYKNEYRERLSRYLGDYAEQVAMLKKNAMTNLSSCQVLFGMEMDWLAGEEDFVEKAARAFPFDYLIGSVHFLDHWGFDASAADWEGLSQEECEKLYVKYFAAWKKMIESGLFQIAAHPDLIKIFSVGQFHAWLAKKKAQDLIRDSLTALKNSGMALEISSAGLRKPCGEIYPAPMILSIAAEFEIPVALASDAHCTGDVAYAFSDLAGYAHSFGYSQQAFFNNGKINYLPF